jgi:flagellar assembly protein FliH
MNSSTNTAQTNAEHDETSSIRKFLFDRSFDDEPGSGSKKRARAKQTFTSEQIEAARKESCEEGFTTGQKAAMENQQQVMNVLLSGLDQKLTRLAEDSKKHWQELVTHAREMALAIARKALPVYAERNGLAEIEAIVTQAIGEMAHEPRLVVRVGESQFDAVSSKIKEISEQKAYNGKVAVLCDSALGPADCRVEWADGGIERDMSVLWQAIDRLMEPAVRMAPTGTPETPASNAEGTQEVNQGETS